LSLYRFRTLTRELSTILFSIKLYCFSHHLFEGEIGGGFCGGEKFVKDINDLGVLPFTLDFFDAEFEYFNDEHSIIDS
jgi:hypothetical protein